MQNAARDKFDLRTLMRAQLEAASVALEWPKPADAVHRCRTALKRVRALARLAQIAEPGLAGQMIARIRPIMQGFGDIRDLDALEACARRMSESLTGDVRGTLRTVARKIGTQRKGMDPPPIAETAKEVRALIQLMDAWPPLRARALEAGARRLKRRADRAYEDAMDARSREARHQWRKREKERLYCVLLLGDNWPKKLPRKRRLGQALGETLGQEREVLMLIERLSGEPMLAGAPDDADRALAALMKAHAKLRKRADALGKRLHRA
ncbi:MAG: CHAD domain-containing protein [Hyphomonadaceae bacterium]